LDFELATPAQPVREIADTPTPNIARTALNDTLKSRSCMKENLEELSTARMSSGKSHHKARRSTHSSSHQNP
jgi:hypothetical protein